MYGKITFTPHHQDGRNSESCLENVMLLATHTHFMWLLSTILQATDMSIDTSEGHLVIDMMYFV